MFGLHLLFTVTLIVLFINWTQQNNTINKESQNITKKTTFRKYYAVK